MKKYNFGINDEYQRQILQGSTEEELSVLQDIATMFSKLSKTDIVSIRTKADQMVNQYEYGNMNTDQAYYQVSREKFSELCKNNGIDLNGLAYTLRSQNYYPFSITVNPSSKDTLDAIKYLIARNQQQAVLLAGIVYRSSGSNTDDWKMVATRIHVASNQPYSVFDAGVRILYDYAMKTTQGSQKIKYDKYVADQFKDGNELKDKIDELTSYVNGTVIPKDKNGHELSGKALNDRLELSKKQLPVYTNRWNKYNQLIANRNELNKMITMKTDIKYAGKPNSDEVKKHYKVANNKNIAWLTQHQNDTGHQDEYKRLREEAIQIVAQMKDDLAKIDLEIKKVLGQNLDLHTSITPSISSLMSRLARVNNFACTGKWYCPDCGQEMKRGSCPECGYSD